MLCFVYFYQIYRFYSDKPCLTPVKHLRARMYIYFLHDRLVTQIYYRPALSDDDTKSDTKAVKNGD